MKPLLTLSLLTTFTLNLGGLGFAADFSGKWKSEFESQIGHLNYVYDLKADGTNLTGKAIRELEGQKTEVELKEGRINGDEISFVELVRREDLEMRIEYKGKLAGDELKFTRKVGDFATLDIVAKRALKVVKVDSEETSGEDGKGANAVDGNPATHWHTQWESDSPPHPHEIIIELGAPAKIKGFTYLTRQDEEVNGSIKEYEFYVSDDGKEFGPPVKKGSFTDTKSQQTATFEVKSAKFIKLKALSEVNDQAWTSAAEIGVISE